MQGTWIKRAAAIALSVATAAGATLVAQGDAQARNVRNTTRTSVNRNATVNHNTDVNRNTNVDVNRNVDVHRDIDVDYDRNWYRPAATAVGVAAAATVTAVAIGSVVNTLPPSCTTVPAGDVTYQNCGGTYYQPQYSGSQVTYVVVNPP